MRRRHRGNVKETKKERTREWKETKYQKYTND